SRRPPPPWIGRLAIDCIFPFDNVASFFAGDPQDRSAWTAAFTRVRAHQRPRAEIAAVIAAQQARRQAPAPARGGPPRRRRAEIGAVIAAQQARREAPAPARAAAAKLADAATVAVVT